MRKEAGDYEPLFRLESWRVLVEKRADGKVDTEATIKIWLGGERYVRTAEGNGPVNALDEALRDAIGEIHPHLRDIELVNFKVRILDESEGHRRGHARADRRLRRARRVGLDRRLGERDRGLLGRAGRLAGVRHAAGAQAASGAGAPSAGRRRDAVQRRADPARPPVLGEAEERAVIEVLRSGQLSLGPRLEEFERAFAARLGAPLASAVTSGTAGLHLALRAVGVQDGDEVITSPFSFVASANAALYERARPVFADIDPVTLNLDPQAAAAARDASARGRCCRCTSSATRPTCRRSRRSRRARASAIVEDACEALGARHADGRAVGARGHPAVFGFYANKQLTTGEGGMITLGEPGMKERIDSERNQGRAPDMGWLDHDRLGFNYRLSDIACALGLAQLARLEEMLAGRARVAALYREALAGIEGLTLPCEDRGAERRGWFVFVVQLPRGVDRDETVRTLCARGVQSKPYLPAIHLMSFYRERFGHREGEFPVCEDVAARSLALPFFPAMSEGQIERVASELRAVLAGAPA